MLKKPTGMLVGGRHILFEEPDPRLSWEAQVSRRAAGKARGRSYRELQQGLATHAAVMDRRMGVATSLGSGS